MVRYEQRIRFLAVGLSALAGFVDVTGFLELRGFFVAFMSGNTTRLAVGLAQGAEAALIAGGIIVTFVLGVIAGTLAGHFASEYRAAATLALVSVLLAFAAGFGAVGFEVAAITAMALAMGVENAVLVQGGEVQLGLTYITGTLVKMGQRLAAAILGGDRLAWWPYFLLWFGLACGSVAGALVYPYMGLNSLWLAAGAAALFAFVARRTDPEPDRQS
jgi:uncharacterized membrane protein YoaK (UPF0700 family)